MHVCARGVHTVCVLGWEEDVRQGGIKDVVHESLTSKSLCFG